MVWGTGGICQFKQSGCMGPVYAYLGGVLARFGVLIGYVSLNNPVVWDLFTPNLGGDCQKLVFWLDMSV